MLMVGCAQWKVYCFNHNEQLLKHLILIHPTPPVPSRRAISIQDSTTLKKGFCIDRFCFKSQNTRWFRIAPFSQYIGSTDKDNNSFIIVILILVGSSTVWSDLEDGIFSPDNQRYTNQLLIQLDDERKETMISIFSSIKTDQSSSNDSSIPCECKFETNVIENDKQSSYSDTDSQSSQTNHCLVAFRADLNKYEIINDWLRRYVDNSYECQWNEGKL
jgi:hypothetical protein